MNMIFNAPTINGVPVRTPEMVAADLLSAKKSEYAATSERIALENELIELLGIEEEGSKTHNRDGFKIVITQGINREIDLDMLDAIPTNKFPVELRPVKSVRKTDVAAVKKLRNNEPELYALLAPALTVKPGKPSVVVTRVE